jgi:hypothetical protein
VDQVAPKPRDPCSTRGSPKASKAGWSGTSIVGPARAPGRLRSDLARRCLQSQAPPASAAQETPATDLAGPADGGALWTAMENAAHGLAPSSLPEAAFPTAAHRAWKIGSRGRHTSPPTVYCRRFSTHDRRPGGGFIYSFSLDKKRPCAERSPERSAIDPLSVVQGRQDRLVRRPGGALAGDRSGGDVEPGEARSSRL